MGSIDPAIRERALRDLARVEAARRELRQAETALAETRVDFMTTTRCWGIDEAALRRAVTA